MLDTELRPNYHLISNMQTRKRISTAVGAWTNVSRKSWNNTPELVLIENIFKVLSCIVTPIIIWYLIWGYGYDTIACSMQSDFLSKGSETLVLDDFCDHDYSDYLSINVRFSLVMLIWSLPRFGWGVVLRFARQLSFGTF